MLCEYGCCQEAKYQFKNGKWCCNDSYNKCEFVRKNKSKNRIGILNPNFGKKQSIKSRKMISLSKIGKNRNEELKKKLSKFRTGKTYEQLMSVEDAIKCRKKLKEWCLKGHALKMIKAIKKISNEEIKLRDMVKELYPDCVFQYPVFNYSLDIALVKEKIAIEYDGYYHFCSEENKIYHKQRQEKIEKEGWIFLKYTMFDKFPNLKKIEEDIKKCKKCQN